jgi:predicted DNA-binding protein
MEIKKIFIKVTMSTSDKIQFKMMITPELLERLEKLAQKHGKRSGQHLVEELIDVYLPTWAAINDAMGRSLNHQLQIISEEKLASERKQNKQVQGELATNSKNKILMKKVPKTEQKKVA